MRPRLHAYGGVRRRGFGCLTRRCSEPKPKLRYMVVPNQEQAEDTIKAQIEQLVQLNEGQRYTYDRPTLTKMLDAALVGARPRSK